MKIYLKSILFTLAMANLAAQAHDGEYTSEKILTYDHRPVVVFLPVDKEVRVHFDHEIDFGLPQNLSAALQAERINNSLYLKAKYEFPRQRMLIRNKLNGRIVVLDIEATASNSWTSDVRVVARKAHLPSTTNRVSAVDLTRFAAQQLLAPARLQESIPRVKRVPLSDATTIPLLRYGDLLEIPLASWRVDDRYVTAVELHNQSNAVVELDPKLFRGTWYTITFHHSRVMPRDEIGDRTIIYLVSLDTYTNSLSR